METKKYLDQLTYEKTGAAIEVHKQIGSGLLESVYHQCLKKEFLLQNLGFTSEMLVNLSFKGMPIDTQLRCDFLVENIMCVEIKAIGTFALIHDAQLLT